MSGIVSSGKEGHHVHQSHQFGQSVLVFRYRIRTDRDGIAAVSAPGRGSEDDSHVYTYTGSADHDAGCDPRWLFEGRLGHARPASPRAALVVAGAARAAGFD